MTAYITHTDVQLHHCDATGIVFLSRQYEMIHTVIERWFDQELDWPLSQLLGGEGLAMPVRDISTEFPTPSRLGDRLRWSLEVHAVGTSSLTLNITASATHGGDVHLRCRCTLVLAEAQVLRPRSWPDTTRKRFQTFQTAPAPLPE